MGFNVGITGILGNTEQRKKKGENPRRKELLLPFGGGKKRSIASSHHSPSSHDTLAGRSQRLLYNIDVASLTVWLQSLKSSVFF